MSTSAVEVSIHAVSPLLILSTPTTWGVSGAGGADAAAAASALGASPALVSAAEAAGAAVGGAAGAAAGAFWSGALSCAVTSPHTATTPISAINASNRFMMFPLESIGTGLAGPDAHDLLEVEDEDLAVADLSGIRGLLDGLDHPI